MEVWIPAGSPLMAYQPCRACEYGWTMGATGHEASIHNNGTDPGWYTSAQSTTVAMDFFGTGLRFDVDFAPLASTGSPGAGPSSDVNSRWSLSVLLNGTQPDAAHRTSKGVMGLPAGKHHVQLTLARTDTNETERTWARVNGAMGVLDVVVGNRTSNMTVDDTQWAAGQVELSTGWNMLEAGHSNYLNETEFLAEQQNASRFYNNSMSWTDQQGGNSTIRFNGSTVWVNGVGGAEGGSFEVLIDNVSQGMFDASGGPKVFNQIMYFTSGLTEGPHTLSLINRGGRLSFDYLMASSGLVDAATVPIAAPSPVKYVPSSTASLRAETSLTATTISAVPAAATEASNGPSKNVIVGASVGGVLVLLGLILFGLVLFLWCRRRKERHERTGQNEKQPWYKPAKTRRFVALLDGGTSELGYSKHDTLKSDASHLSHTSGSSFGVLANGSSMRLAPPRPAAARDPIHMRRSLLPFKNNLWAKAREEAARAAEDASADQDQDQDFDGPIVPRNTDTLRAHASSPDPMAAALGNVTSPLTQLQRNFSQRAGMKGSGSKSNNLYKSSDNINANIGMNPNSSKAAAPAPADAQLPMFDDMPQVGSREWYQVFGLSPNGNGNGNGNGNSKERTSGFSLFRRSANSAKSGSSGISGSSTMAVRIPSPPPMPNIPSAGPGRAGMLEVDTQYADPQAGYTTGAQERSPRRSFFGRGNQVDSLWARV